MVGFPFVLKSCKGQAHWPLRIEVACAVLVAVEVVGPLRGLELGSDLLLFLDHLLDVSTYSLWDVVWWYQLTKCDLPRLTYFERPNTMRILTNHNRKRICYS